MGRFKINFELKELDHVALWGEEPNQNISWFGLTDGWLWINVGEQTIYEYSEESQNYFNRFFVRNNDRYNDYQISRFLEDFSFLFRYIGESVPQKMYDDIEDFDNKEKRWLEVHNDEPDDVFDAFYDTDYVGLTTWFHSRTMYSGHLIGGPQISFYRCGDKIKIIWVSTYKMESGNSIWTSPSGIIEISYNEFVKEVKDFFQRFYMVMDKQVENAIKKDWGSVLLDKEGLIKENKERKEGFDQAISFLTKPQNHTDWDNVMHLYEKMNMEIGK